ncbi:hypothetical protein [Ramlibacter tataouinensis]|nr:hypothetical protein [Ramlibacter tataouinensis]
MSIRQLSVTYQAQQDRILLRVATADSREMRLWLTRRLLRGLWPLLRRTQVEHGPDATTPRGAVATPEARQMLAQARRQAFLQRADLETPFQEGASRPLGEEPMLAAEVGVTPLAEGRLRLGFSESRGSAPHRAFEMELDPSLVQGLMHLLEQALGQSQWQLPFAPAADAPAAAAEDEPQARPRYLN